jgi:hypothetical protein
MTDGQKNLVWIYVDTDHQVGHPDHLKVLPPLKLPMTGFKRTIPKALRSDTRS